MLQQLELSVTIISFSSALVPVNIEITDVNDNNPQFVGEPYAITISEVSCYHY